MSWRGSSGKSRKRREQKPLKLEGERARLIEQRRPLNELQQKRLELAEKIERVKRARPRVEEYAAEFRQIVDRYLSSDSLEIIDFSHMITSWPHLANAQASQLTNDADLGAHLAKLESDMKLGFSYRLP